MLRTRIKSAGTSALTVLVAVVLCAVLVGPEMMVSAVRSSAAKVIEGIRSSIRCAQLKESEQELEHDRESLAKANSRRVELQRKIYELRRVRQKAMTRLSKLKVETSIILERLGDEEFDRTCRVDGQSSHRLALVQQAEHRLRLSSVLEKQVADSKSRIDELTDLLSQIDRAIEDNSLKLELRDGQLTLETTEFAGQQALTAARNELAKIESEPVLCIPDRSIARHRHLSSPGECVETPAPPVEPRLINITDVNELSDRSEEPVPETIRSVSLVDDALRLVDQAHNASLRNDQPDLRRLSALLRRNIRECQSQLEGHAHH